MAEKKKTKKSCRENILPPLAKGRLCEKKGRKFCNQSNGVM